VDSHYFYFLKVIKIRAVGLLLYGTEVCPTNAADLQSIQFTINRVIIKLLLPLAAASIKPRLQRPSPTRRLQSNLPSVTTLVGV